jgi:hypothetical protein
MEISRKREWILAGYALLKAGIRPYTPNSLALAKAEFD